MNQDEARQPAERVRQLLQSAKQGLLDMGLILIEARENSSPEQFQTFVETKIPPMDPEIRNRIMEGAAKGIDGITNDLLADFAEDVAKRARH